MVRPSLSDPSDWAGWRTGDLIEVLGSGVIRASISRARVLDAAFPEAKAPLDALEGEVAWREGSLEAAVKLGTSALEGLPKKQAMSRWRTMAWRADALRRLGRLTEARPDLQEVLQRWPTAFRMLRLAVPVTVSDDGSALAKDTATRLKRSPRFEVQSKAAPFQVNVSSRAAAVDVCLLDDNGAQLACASGEGASKALDAFHLAAFSPKVSLTQSDLKSLDGSPVRVGAGEAMKGLLGP
jgi:ATP/maltotriose-dependent transcriptional regulator MalT